MIAVGSITMAKEECAEMSARKRTKNGERWRRRGGATVSYSGGATASRARGCVNSRGELRPKRCGAQSGCGVRNGAGGGRVPYGRVNDDVHCRRRRSQPQKGGGKEGIIRPSFLALDLRCYNGTLLAPPTYTNLFFEDNHHIGDISEIRNIICWLAHAARQLINLAGHKPKGRKEIYTWAFMYFLVYCVSTIPW